MSNVNLADIPCEVPDKLTDTSTLGRRVTEILKRINFPNRERTVIAFDSTMFGLQIRMQLEATDTRTGGPISLQHSRQVNSQMSDQELARQICILMSQTAIHEFMENFRFDGAIMFNPHDEGRNGILFDAVAKAASFPEPKVDDGFIKFNIPLADTYSYSFYHSNHKKPKPLPDVEPDLKTLPPLERARALKEKNKKVQSNFGAKDWRAKLRRDAA